MGYQGVWVIKEAIQWLQAVWDIGNAMGYEGVWVILGMCYKGVYCSEGSRLRLSDSEKFDSHGP